MKRIGIISSYAWIKVANNYGALLQYYALQQYLICKGHSAFWIRFVLYHNFNTSLTLNTIKRFLRHPLIYLSTLKCHKSFLKFCEHYLYMSNKIYDKESNPNSYPIADYYITGSDQVWGGTQPEYYLSFVNENSKKISYAASFGKGEISEEHFNNVAPLIKQFAKVSVREDKGVEICKRMGVDAQHLLDPTLLLDKDSYPHTKPIYTQSYVFTYFLNLRQLNDVRWCDIKSFCKKNGLHLKVCAVQGSQYLFNHKDLVYLNPVEWLTAYQYASCILTNTFHGTAFAIIHQRPFLCILQTGESANQNNRMLSLLKTVGLENRILHPNQTIEEAMNTPISWDKVAMQLTKMRLKTDDFFSFLE